jgi:hypothetical protein
MIDWLNSDHRGMSDNIVYLLSEVNDKCQIIELDNEGYLALVYDEESEFKLTFAVFTSNSSDDKDTYLTVQFHGYGFTGGLRECRHTYWGEDGYLFYPNGRVIRLAFKELSKYFDEML